MLKFSSTGNASTVLFAYDTQGHLLGEYGPTGAAIREYVWLGDMPVAMLVPDAQNAAANPPTVYYLHTDHLNTPRAAMDATNALRWRWLSEPFGTLGPETSPTGQSPITVSLRFPGQVYDAESGMHYNYFRDYVPGIGRYAQSDPIGLQGGINTYGYVDANPLSLIDPLGLQAEGHHWIIGPIRRDIDLSSAAKTVFENAKTGPIPGGHNFGEGHAAYNKGVKELWDQHLKQTGIQACNMTAQQAEDFVSRVKTSSDPRIRNFNLNIYNKFIREGFRRMPPLRNLE